MAVFSLGRKSALIAAAAAAVVLAVCALLLTADDTPTTLSDRRLFGLWRTRHAAFAFGLLLVAIGALTAAFSRRALLSYLSTGISAGSVVLVLEIVGLVGFVSWPELFNPTKSALSFQRTPHVDVSGETFQDTAFAWRLPSEPIGFQYRTDRYGFRNAADRDSADVYLLGDSMLVGAIVAFEKTLVARLEALIGRPVMQFALSGQSVQGMQQAFRDTGVDVRGRLAIQFVYEGNDLLDSRTFRGGEVDSASTTIPIADRTLSKQLVLMAQKLSEPTPGIAAMRSCLIGDQEQLFFAARESFEGHEDEMSQVSDALTSFAEEVRSSGGDYAVVFIPAKLRVLGQFCRFPPESDLNDLASHLSPLPAHLQAWSEQTGVPLLDLTEPLEAASRAGSIPWFWGDTHWNEVGHEVAAEALATWEPVKALSLISLSPTEVTLE